MGSSYLSPLLGYPGFRSTAQGQAVKAGSLGQISHGLEARTRREAGNSEKWTPWEGSCDALCGHWRPQVPLPFERETSYLILIFLPGLRLIKYSQGSWITFAQAISSYNSNAEPIYLFF